MIALLLVVVVAVVAVLGKEVVLPVPRNAQEESELEFIKELTQPTAWYTPTGFAAWCICSAIFVAGIPEEQAILEDGAEAAQFCEISVDYVDQSVTATFKPFPDEPPPNPAQFYKVIFRGPTLGCSLVGGDITEAELRAQDTGEQTPIPLRNETVAWPLGDRVTLDPMPPNVNQTCINEIVDEDFGVPMFNTRSTLIIYNEQLIFERYRTVTRRSPLLGWSMTKSITATLVGMLVTEGLIGLDDLADVPEWHETPGDPRGNITYRDLLHMESGIFYTESIHLVICLYVYVDCASFYASLNSGAPPGTEFYYATGESYLLASLVEQQRGQRNINTFDWHRERLFRPMGMDNAVVEFVPFQYMAGGSLAYLNARDWARFGLLYLRNGNWYGNQLIPPSWVQFSCTPTVNSGGAYGAHFWTSMRDLDPNYCDASGFRKQNVFMFPNRNLIVVRHAMPQLLEGFRWDAHDYLSRIISCFD